MTKSLKLNPTELDLIKKFIGNELINVENTIFEYKYLKELKAPFLKRKIQLKQLLEKVRKLY